MHALTAKEATELTQKLLDEASQHYDFEKAHKIRD